MVIEYGCVKDEGICPLAVVHLLSGLTPPDCIPRRGFSFMSKSRKKGRFCGDLRTEYILDTAMEQVLGILTPSNRLVMRTILHTGLRVGDVLALKTVQLSPQFYITEQKTGKRRRVNLGRELLAELEAHAGRVWVFPHRTDPSRHRTRQAVWWDVKRAAKAYRIAANVGTHSARKKYAVDLLKKYGDISKVRRALNHSSDSITILYACADTLVSGGKVRRSRRAARSGRGW